MSSSRDRSGIFTLIISVVEFTSLHTIRVNVRLPGVTVTNTFLDTVVLERGNGSRLGGGGRVGSDGVAAKIIFIRVFTIMIAEGSIRQGGRGGSGEREISFGKRFSMSSRALTRSRRGRRRPTRKLRGANISLVEGGDVVRVRRDDGPGSGPLVEEEVRPI